MLFCAVSDTSELRASYKSDNLGPVGICFCLLRVLVLCQGVSDKMYLFDMMTILLKVCFGCLLAKVLKS